ncbi:MAG: methyltransferase domain-containing protein [Acidimicrobiales bacterium]
MVTGGPAAQRWAQELAAWAIPEDILAAAPTSPWTFPVELFRPAPAPADTPSRRRALEALPDRGSVLDVGAGGGAACLALVPPAAEVTAVDERAEMLASLADAAGARGVAVTTVEGRWPDVAGDVGPADVVTCHHVLYNVADAVPFVAALSSHARRRVVVEITAVHPQAGLNDLWRHFHGLERPEGPDVEEAVAVLGEAGARPRVERFRRPPRPVTHDRDMLVAFARRRLCLGPDADPEVDRLLGPDAGFLTTDAACLWWDVA